MMAAVMALAFTSAEPVTLERVFRQGETSTYDFHTRIMLDVRDYPLETFIPVNDQVYYTFTLTTERLKPDGVADVRFKRNKVTIRYGERFDEPPKEEKAGREESILFTLSRTNQVLSHRDESPKPPPSGGGLRSAMLHYASPAAAEMAFDIIDDWITQMHQLAGFVNFFDLGPILPAHPVEPGETWKQTVGYAPVTVAEGADKGRTLNARIDYVYTFMGEANHGGRPVYHIQGTYKHDTDAAKYIEDLLNEYRMASPFKEIRLQMEGKVDYYLDKSTCAVVRINAEANGYFGLTVNELPDAPVMEEKIKSRASLTPK
ncbi:MAG: hypothetical protein AB1725_09455 [Armatimonadota bacterium]